MKKFIYADNNKQEIVFQIVAKDILEADAQFQIAVGKSPVKMPHIGCQILPENS